jgi:periplasmic divalent cation tolerance protein
MIFNDKINSGARVGVGRTTTATPEEATRIAQGLVKTGLVRCAQISAPIISIYTWEDRVETDTEYRITLKFLISKALEIEEYLTEHHSYEVPQWIWVEATGASEEYGKWLFE